MNKLALCLIVLSAAARADDVQIIVTGNGCTTDWYTCNTAPQNAVPVSETFSVDTTSAQLTPYFVNGYLQEIDGNVNYTIDGQASNATVFIARESGIGTATTDAYELFLNGPGVLNFHTALPAMTQAQFQSLNDPFLTLLNDASWGNESLAGGGDGGSFGPYSLTLYEGQVSDLSVQPQLFAASLPQVSVPEPSPLVLFALGFAILLLRGGRPARS